MKDTKKLSIEEMEQVTGGLSLSDSLAEGLAAAHSDSLTDGLALELSSASGFVALESPVALKQDLEPINIVDGVKRPRYRKICGGRGSRQTSPRA